MPPWLSVQAMPGNFDFSGLSDSPEDLAKAKDAAKAAGVPGRYVTRRQQELQARL